MINRRVFLKTAAAVGSSGLLKPIRSLGSRRQSVGYFNVHPFIESHPEAVFIMRTNVSDKLNAEEKMRAGLTFGRSVFVPSDESGIPLNITIPVKPNFLNRVVDEDNPLEDVMGTSVDTYFLEGLFEGMKNLGIKGKQFSIRDGSDWDGYASYGHVAMAERVGQICVIQDPVRWKMGVTIRSRTPTACGFIKCSNTNLSACRIPGC